MLAEVKAGKMDYDGRMVKPQRKKGIIRITKNAEGMTIFSWCDAETKNPIDNLYVFPGEASFEKVKQSSDRVYLLQFRGSERRFFYFF